VFFLKNHHICTNNEYFSLKRIIKFLTSIYLWDTTVSLYHVLKILWQKVIVFDIDQRAAAVSYSFLLAVFPGVIFLFTLIPYIPIQHLDLLIMEFLGKVLPKGIYENTSNTIQDIVSRKRSDILSFGFFFTVFAATNGMMSLMGAFNMALMVREKRTYFRARMIALFLTVLLIGVLICAILILVVGTFLIDFLFECKDTIRKYHGKIDESLLSKKSVYLKLHSDYNKRIEH
jgi:membrane protein